MKKLFGIMMAIVVLLTGCTTSEPQQTTFNVLCPTGAPTLAWLSTYEEITETGKFDVTEGTDQLTAEFAKEDSEYDIIVAPVNLGAKLISLGKTKYTLAGVITWGNLYIVGTEGALEGTGLMGTFGTGAVPAKVFETANVQTSLTVQDYGTSGASLVSSDLIAGNLNAGMLAEPLVTATIAKAKQAGKELKVLADLQELYKTATGSKEYGYPQAAIFVKEGVDASYILDQVSEWSNGDKADAQTLLDTIGTDTLGLPASQVVVNSMARQNVGYKPASEVSEQLTTFLKLFGIDWTNE